MDLAAGTLSATEKKPYGGLTDYGVTEEEGMRQSTIHHPAFESAAPHLQHIWLRAHTCKRSKHEPEHDTRSRALPHTHTRVHTLDKERAIMMLLLSQRRADSPRCACCD